MIRNFLFGNRTQILCFGAQNKFAKPFYWIRIKQWTANIFDEFKRVIVGLKVFIHMGGIKLILGILINAFNYKFLKYF